MKLHITYEHPIAINAFRWTPNHMLKPLHYHSSLEIGLCTGGSGFFYFGDKAYSVQQGDIFIVNNLEPHIAKSDADDPSTYIFINFDPGLLLQEEETLLLPFAYQSSHFDNRIPAESPLAARLRPYIEAIWEELSGKRPGYHSMAKSALLHLCVQLLRHYADGLPQREWTRMKESYLRIRPALAVIDERFREPIELSDVAAALKLSPSRVSRLLQQELGRNFKDYLVQLRINEAKRLLISTALSAADVCFESGFQSVPSFNRLFKQHLRMTPMEYRDRYSVREIIENRGQEVSR